jgi:hypothetical protein
MLQYRISRRQEANQALELPAAPYPVHFLDGQFPSLLFSYGYPRCTAVSRRPILLVVFDSTALSQPPIFGINSAKPYLLWRIKIASVLLRRSFHP